MSEIKNVFDVAGRAMAAQMVRLNTVASNLANANSLSGSEADAYKPLRPVFETIYADNVKATGISTAQAVEVTALDRRPERLTSRNIQKPMQMGLFSSRRSIWKRNSSRCWRPAASIKTMLRSSQRCAP
jgi:hypothetical protein